MYKAKDYNLQGKKATICKDGHLVIPGFSTANISAPNFKFPGYSFNSISEYLADNLNSYYHLYDMISDYNKEDYFFYKKNVKETILNTLNQTLNSEEHYISLSGLDIEDLSKSIYNELDKELDISYLLNHESYWSNEDIKYDDVIDSIGILLTLFF